MYKVPLRTHHTFLDFHPTRMKGKLEQGIIVPQKVYTPAYCEYGWKPHSPITFVFDGRPGVNLAEAQDWKLEGSDLPPRVCRLDEATRMWTLSDKQQVQIRILWPGYYTKKSRKNKIPLSRSAHSVELTYSTAKIAQKIAKRVSEYLAAHMFVPHTEPGDDWSIACWPPEAVYLLRIENVSKGSWQPVLSVDPYFAAASAPYYY
ncbi:hypothetical protein BC629DRAFT_199350 [Irpex lacteus]|nr:hypothetical protein BC629DRAFT_199350 [Irpex lacteus]